MTSLLDIPIAFLFVGRERYPQRHCRNESKIRTCKRQKVKYLTRTHRWIERGRVPRRYSARERVPYRTSPFTETAVYLERTGTWQLILRKARRGIASACDRELSCRCRACARRQPYSHWFPAGCVGLLAARARRAEAVRPFVESGRWKDSAGWKGDPRR